MSFVMNPDVICNMMDPIEQCFSTFARPQPGKFFFYKMRALSQQIYL